MSTTDWEQLQTLAATLKRMAHQLDRRPDYDPATSRLILAMQGIADLATSAETMPSPLRVTALLQLIDEEVRRLS